MTPHGFKDASADASEIFRLWTCYPGPLIGMVTGGASGIAVLDLDFDRHSGARKWYDVHRRHLGPTLAIETRSGGLHLYFRHHAGLRCSAGRIAPGVDVRADGGYVIAWAAHGHKVVLEAPLASWPDWLAPPPPTDREVNSISVPDDVSISRLISFVAEAPAGQRNNRLYWMGRRLAEYVATGLLSQNEATALASQAGIAAGLPQEEARRTARSAVFRRKL
jgi:hypothetical protein